MKETAPLISIGIPTYNRSGKLRELLVRLLAQTYQNLEIIVSDNCSPGDDVTHVLDEFKNKDTRINTFRQQKNTGLANNFQFVLDAAHGDFFMWISDDDIPPADFIEKTYQVFLLCPECNLVMGQTCLYNSNGDLIRTVRSVKTIDNPSPVQRVYEYFKNLDTGGYFYGLYRTRVIKQVGYTNKMLGADILISIAMVFSGKVEVISSTSFGYCIGAGASSDIERLASIVGLGRFHAAFFGFNDAWVVAKTILTNPLFKTAKPIARMQMSFGCYIRMLKYTDAFYSSFVVIKRMIFRRLLGRNTLKRV